MVGIRNIGGQKVGRGNYWNFATGERVHIEERGMLPGDEAQRYYRAHPVVVLAAAPVLGLVYAVFLPFIGIAMLLNVVGRKVFGGMVDTAWKGASFSWRPSEAYLAGRQGKKREGQERKEDQKKE